MRNMLKTIKVHLCRGEALVLVTVIGKTMLKVFKR